MTNAIGRDLNALSGPPQKPDPPPCRLSFLDLSYPDVASNLALDEALLLAAEEHRAGSSLRVWESQTYAVVLGASGRLHEDVDVSHCLADGVTIARRSSGGGTVVIGPGALNVCVVLPCDAAPGLLAVDVAQRFVLERVASAIRETGLDATVQGSGDLTLGARKFSGSSQRRLREFFMVHASILYDFPLERIARWTRLPVRQPSYREHREHTDFLTNVDLSRRRLIDALKTAWLTDENPERATVPEDLVERLVREKFGDSGWVERL